MEMEIDQIKKVCKQRGCTINDYCFALISVALYRYMEKDPPKFVQMLMPISLRTRQENLHDFQINNQVVTMPLQLPIYSNFDRALPKIKDYLSSIKGPNFPLAL